MFETANIPITPEVLTLIAEIDEFKGAWHALGIDVGTGLILNSEVPFSSPGKT